VLAGYRPVFGDLGKKPVFIAALAAQLETLREHGVLHALQEVAREPQAAAPIADEGEAAVAASVREPAGVGA